MDETRLLPVLLGELHKKLARLTDLVERDVAFPETPNKIKVAMGMRRVGKTYFLYQHMKRLLKDGISLQQILFINFEDDRLLSIDHVGLGKLVDAFYALYPENHERTCYLFFDEIQNVDSWAQVMRRLHDTQDVEIFLTGSSAKLLSKEIATSLRGRSLAVEIWPYSFKEFLRAKKIVVSSTLYDKPTEDRLKKAFNEYLLVGGFPEVVSYPQDVRQQTLQEYLDIVIYRDIIERHRISNPTVIKYMIMSMLHNTAHLFTVHKFYHEMRRHGHKIGKDQLYSYAEYIEDAYVGFFVPSYESALRKKRATPKKVYAIHPGLVCANVFIYERDLGRLFANVIFLELKRRRYAVSYYKSQEGREVDFVAQTAQGLTKCFQVVWDTSDPRTRAREEKALEACFAQWDGKHPVSGEIVTLDRYLADDSVLDSA